jgi:hypothetical protein
MNTIHSIESHVEQEIQETPEILPETCEIQETPDPLPKWSSSEIDLLKNSAMLLRDQYVECINDISSYRFIMDREYTITRDFISLLDPFSPNPRLIEHLRVLPAIFAFVMAIRNDDCRAMSDSEIIDAFFGEESREWIADPNCVFSLSQEKQTEIQGNYEYMAYIVINETDELAFRIRSMQLNPLDQTFPF